MNPNKIFICAAIALLGCMTADAMTICEKGMYPPFGKYAEFVEKCYGISWKLPAGFADADSACFWGPSTPGAESQIGLEYAAMLQSADKNCSILYCNLRNVYDFKFGYFDKHSGFTLDELYGFLLGRDVRKYRTTEQPQQLDVDKLAFGYANTEKARQEIGNARIIQLYDLPIKKPFLGSYNHCVGVYVHKTDRPSMFFKVFTTDEGWKNIDSYLDSLFANVKYEQAVSGIDETASTKLFYDYVMPYRQNLTDNGVRYTAEDQ